MDYILLLTISSSVVSVIGFLVSILKDFKWSTLLLCVVSAITLIPVDSICIDELETEIKKIDTFFGEKILSINYSSLLNEIIDTTSE